MLVWQSTALLYLAATLTILVGELEAQACQHPQSGQLLYIYGLPGSGAAAVKVRKFAHAAGSRVSHDH